MINKLELLDLAARLKACAEDAKRPEPLSDNLCRQPSPAIISLANGLSAIVEALVKTAAQ
jgi:hypothetical protein